MPAPQDDDSVYDRIRKEFISLFGENIADAAIAEKIGVSKHLIGKWKKRLSRPSYKALAAISAITRRPIDYFITGSPYALPGIPVPDSVPNAFRPREPVNFVLDAKSIPVVGEAAADETRGRKAGFLPSDPEARYDMLHFPETTAAVRIIGDSMSPVLLNGQYALIGPEYMGKFDTPGDHEIVVVDVDVRDDEQAGSDARWTGTYCKRIANGGDVWFLLSINPVGTPFTVSKNNCRIWPVIGVWFAGKGEPPRN